MDSGGELSYDDSVPYEDQVSLAERIGSTKVYLLSDTTRRKPADDVENDAADGEDMDTDQDPSLRPNAILLHGPPIAHLPTNRIFDYAAHFDVRPLALEWIDDNTCIFVFLSKSAARSAFVALQKPSAVASDTTLTAITTTTTTTTTMDARPIPVALWPPEDRIHHSLGVGQGLRGTLSMRWARIDDKKKRNSKRESAFYRKHGVDAGKESAGFGVVPASVAAAAAGDAGGAQGDLAKRLAAVGDTLEERIEMDGEDDAVAEVEGVREWDRGKPGMPSGALEGRISSSSSSRKRKRRKGDDVDEFLGDDLEEEELNGDAVEDGDAPDVRASPPSKMRSDYIAEDGRTVIGSADGPGLVERIAARLPRRTRAGGRRGETREEDLRSRRRDGRGRRRTRGAEGGSEPPRKKTREELDDELDAFLNDRD